jgi:hypothetical protein
MPKNNPRQVLAAYAVWRVAQAYPVFSNIFSVQGRVSSDLCRQIILATYPLLPPMAGETPVLLRYLIRYLEDNESINWPLVRRAIRLRRPPRRPNGASAMLHGVRSVPILDQETLDSTVDALQIER